jgi:hypothetical protein
MAIFGRNSARQRLRRAAQESLKIPAFTPPVDATPWITGGLWPAELSMVTAETAPLVKHLKADLQRIVSSANEELKRIRCAGLVDSTRQAEEARVINEARAYAVHRVESTVRHLHDMKSTFPSGHRNGYGFAETDNTTRFKPVTPQQDPQQTTGTPTAEVTATVTPVAPPKPRPQPSAPRHALDSEDTEVIEELATLLQAVAPPAEPPVDAPPPRPLPPPVAEITSRHAEPGEAESERLERLLKFVARQEPGLPWAVGVREDGTTLLVTDLAHGWVPPGITLPDQVRLLEPGRRKGTAAAMLGQTALLVTYAPGDPLGWASDYAVTDTSSKPRELPAVENLGWVLGEATRGRDGLPRMVNTLARAGATGTGIVDAEIDVLRVHLDTARYQLLAQYPDVDPGQLLNCLLLAATEGIATKNGVNANYHLAWFQALNSVPLGNWKTGQ